VKQQPRRSVLRWANWQSATPAARGGGVQATSAGGALGRMRRVLRRPCPPTRPRASGEVARRAAGQGRRAARAARQRPHARTLAASGRAPCSRGETMGGGRRWLPCGRRAQAGSLARKLRRPCAPASGLLQQPSSNPPAAREAPAHQPSPAGLAAPSRPPARPRHESPSPRSPLGAAQAWPPQLAARRRTLHGADWRKRGPGIEHSKTARLLFHEPARHLKLPLPPQICVSYPQSPNLHSAQSS
jgi:hypothetical protein